MEGLGKGRTDRDVRASSSRVRVICVAFASRAFSMSSLRMDGMSRISCPLEIFWIVVVQSFLIILKQAAKIRKYSKAIRRGVPRFAKCA